MDSVSRSHFFRKLPKTADFLNTVRQNDVYSVFDFKLYNIFGLGTKDNITYLFSGRTGEYNFDKDTYKNEVDGDLNIWHTLRKRGFVSMLGYEGCPFKLYRAIGMNPK